MTYRWQPVPISVPSGVLATPTSQTVTSHYPEDLAAVKAERDTLRAENGRLWEALDRAGTLPEPVTPKDEADARGIIDYR